MVIGIRPILQPPTPAAAIAGAEPEAALELGQVGIFETKEMKLGFANRHTGCVLFRAFKTEATALRQSGRGHEE